MRTHLLLVSALLTAGTVAPAASAASKPRFVKHTRTVTMNYSAPCTLTTFGAVRQGPSVTFGDVCTTADFGFVTNKLETYITVRAIDKTGRPVPLLLQPQANSTEPIAVVCGQTKNLRIAPRRAYQVTPSASLAQPTCPTPATSGTIVVTLSNYRR